MHAVLLDFTSIMEETTAFIRRFCCTADFMKYTQNPQERQKMLHLKYYLQQKYYLTA